MGSSKIENLVRQSFDEFYLQRLMKLTGVTLSDLLRKKNLYLLCATNCSSVSKIIEKMLEAMTVKLMKVTMALKIMYG